MMRRMWPPKACGSGGFSGTRPSITDQTSGTPASTLFLTLSKKRLLRVWFFVRASRRTSGWNCLQTFPASTTRVPGIGFNDTSGFFRRLAALL